jgi:hypothetical protein
VLNRDRLFISFAGPDTVSAEWVAWCLRDDGFEVELDTDWAAGDNFVTRMGLALKRADRVIALFSAAYFEPGRFTEDEWTAVVAHRNRAGRLIPLRLEEVEPPEILRPLIRRDLFGIGEDAARVVLLEAVHGPVPPTVKPPFPPGL